MDTNDERLEIALELEKRGELPKDKQEILTELRNRGVAPPPLQKEPSSFLPGVSKGAVSDMQKYLPGFLKEQGKNFATGALNMLDAPSHIAQELPDSFKKLVNSNPAVFSGIAAFVNAPPAGKLLNEALGGALKNKEKPVTGSMEGYLRSTMEGLGGAAFGPGNAIVKLVQALAGGTGGELSAGLLGEKGRILGEIGGMVVPGVASSRMPNAMSAAKEPFAGVSEREVLEAVAKKKRAQETLGAPVSITQSFDRAGTPMEEFGQMLGSAPEFQRVFEAQTRNAKGLAEKFVEDASPLALDQKTANRVRDAGGDFVDNLKDFRASKSNPKFDALGNKDVQAFDLVKIIRAISDKQKARRAAPESPESAVYADLMDRYSDMLKRGVQNKKATGSTGISLGEAYGPSRVAGAAAYDMEVPSSLRGAKTDAAMAAKKEWEKLYPEIADANATHARFSLPLDQWKNSPISKYFSEKRTQKPGDLEKFSKMLDESPDQISYARKILGNSDKEAFPAVAKEYWTNKLNKAYASDTGQTSPEASGKFANLLTKGADRERFLTTVSEVAKARGQDALEARMTAGSLLDAWQVASRGRKGFALDEQEIFRKASQNPASTVARAPGVVFGGPSPMAFAIDRAVGKRVDKQLLEIFFDDDFVEKYRKILKTTKGELRTKALTNAILTSIGTSGEEE